jgi:four helix bundle protein
MHARSLEELQVLQRALEAADAVSAILDRPSLRRDSELRAQLADCSASVPAQISEGFGQKTDRHCAHYQYLARGSCNEMQAHLTVAVGRKHIKVEERAGLVDRYVVIGKMLTQWLKHLNKENRTLRG